MRDVFALIHLAKVMSRLIHSGDRCSLHGFPGGSQRPARQAKYQEARSRDEPRPQRADAES